MIAVTLLYIFVKLYQIICLNLLILLYIKYIIVKLMKGKKIKKWNKKKMNISSDYFQSDQKHDSPLSNDQIVLSWDNVSKIQNYPTSDLIPDQPSNSLDMILILLMRKLNLDVDI